MGKVNQRSAFRLGTSALSIIGALIASSSLALAHDDDNHNPPPPPPPPVTAFDGIGIGYLNGPDPDANKSEISFKTSVDKGKVTTDADVEYQRDARDDNEGVGGKEFSLTQYDHVTGSTGHQGHGEDDDSGKSANYIDSFTFDLNSASSVTFTPDRSEGHGSDHEGSWNGKITLVKGVLGKDDQIVSFESATKGKHDSLIFANLGAGEYSLVFQGVVGGSDCGEGSNKYGGTISAVPLPGSIAMFGSALLGLTALGARRRKNTAV